MHDSNGSTGTTCGCEEGKDDFMISHLRRVPLSGMPRSEGRTMLTGGESKSDPDMCLKENNNNISMNISSQLKNYISGFLQRKY